MANVRYCLGVVVLLLVMTSLSPAQAPTGTILGVVKDASGGVVTDAAVTITDTETGITRTLTTGADGAYRAPALPVGQYSVKVEKSGFQSETQTGLTLEVGQELVVNSSLQVGASTQEVMVTGEVPVVNTTSSSLGGVVNEQKMADLPLNGRNWVDLAIMQPGVTQHTNISGGTPTGAPGETITANGATTRSNNYTLDGAFLQTFNGTTSSSISGTTLGVDGIREFRVETNSFSAEFGLRMGSQATLVSKSGTNSFHGSAFEYLRNSSMDAANFFDSPADTPPGKRLPPFKRNQFGGSVGGPIRKDKTFFFANFEGLQRRTGLTEVGTSFQGPNTVLTNLGVTGTCRQATSNPCATTTANPTGAVNPLIVPYLGDIPGTSTLWFANPTLPNNQYSFPFTNPASEQFGQLRLDQTFSDKDTAFLRYTIDRDREIRPPTNLPTEDASDLLFSQSQLITVSETHIFSATLLNTARFSSSAPQIGYSEATPEYPGPSGPISFIPGYPSIGTGSVSPGGGITTTPSGASISQFHSALAWSDDVFYTKGKHALKFGTLVTRQVDGVINANTNKGSLTFSSLANFLSPITTPVPYVSYSALTPGSNVLRRYDYGTVGFYAQDDIRLTSRFTLNAGLRYEFIAPNYDEVDGLGAALRNVLTDQNTTPGPAIRNPSLRAVSPRLGFAWDIFGDGKTALRAGGAELYDIADIGASIGQGAGATPVGPALNLIGSSVTTITAASATAACPAPVLTIPFTFPTCDLANSLTTFDYASKQPHNLVWNVTIDRQLPWGIGLSTGYVGSRGLDLYNRIDGDPCIPEAVVNGVPDWVNTANKACPKGRLNPYWTDITLATTNGDSWYDALQVVATKRLNHGLQFQGNFTWAKNIDTGDGQLPADNTTATYAPGFNRLDRGPAGFDLSKNFRLNTIYHFPTISSGGKFVDGLVNGWWVSEILSLQTGFPFNPTLNTNHSLSGVLGSQADLADLVPGRSAGSITSGVSTGCGTASTTTKNIPAGTPLGTPTLWFDPCAFTDTYQKGYLGTEPRNYIWGPPLGELDFSAVKDTAVKYFGEGGLVEFRAEIFNITNHPSFAVPGFVVYTGNGITGIPAGATPDSPLLAAGVITKTVNTSRQIQLALRVQF